MPASLCVCRSTTLHPRALRPPLKRDPLGGYHMTDRTQRALRLGTRAGLYMAGLGALNVVLFGGRVATAFSAWLGLLLAVSSLSFVLLGTIFFGLAYVDASPANEPHGPRFWNRPFTHRQTLIAYLVTGWLAAFLIVGIGDYELRHRLPTFSELRLYVLLALIGGPIISLFAAWRISRLHRIEGSLRRDDSNAASGR